MWDSLVKKQFKTQKPREVGWQGKRGWIHARVCACAQTHTQHSCSNELRDAHALAHVILVTNSCAHFSCVPPEAAMRTS